MTSLVRDGPTKTQRRQKKVKDKGERVTSLNVGCSYQRRPSRWKPEQRHDPPAARGQNYPEQKEKRKKRFGL